MRVMPSMTGIFKSVITRSTVATFSLSSASWPCSASITSNPPSRRVKPTICRMETESSTTITFFNSQLLSRRGLRSCQRSKQLHISGRSFCFNNPGDLALLAHGVGTETLDGCSCAGGHVANVCLETRRNSIQILDDMADALADAILELKAAPRRTDIGGQQRAVGSHAVQHFDHLAMCRLEIAQRSIHFLAALLHPFAILLVHPP